MNTGKPDIAGLTQRLQELGLRINEGNARLVEGDQKGAYEVFRNVWHDVQAELETNSGGLDRRSMAVRLGIIAPLVGLLENLGATAISQGVLIESAAALREALALIGPAIDPVAVAKRSELLGCLGNTEAARGHWAESAAAFREALAWLGPDPDLMTALERSTYHMGLGEAAYGQKQYDAAEQEFQNALDLYPALADVGWWHRRFAAETDPALKPLREASAGRQWSMAVRAMARQADCAHARGDIPGFIRRIDGAIALADAHGLADLVRTQRHRRDELLRESGPGFNRPRL